MNGQIEIYVKLRGLGKALREERKEDFKTSPIMDSKEGEKVSLRELESQGVSYGKFASIF